MMIKKGIIGLSIMLVLLLVAGCSVGTSGFGVEECIIDAQQAFKLIFKGEQYVILEEKAEENAVGKKIGAIQKYIALDSEYRVLSEQQASTNPVKDLIKLKQSSKGAISYKLFLNVYESKVSQDEIIIEVEDAFHVAKHENEISDEDKKIQLLADLDDEMLEIEINPNDCTQLIVGNQRYQITKEKVDQSKIGEYMYMLAEARTFNVKDGKPLSKADLGKLKVLPGEDEQGERVVWTYGAVYNTLETLEDSVLYVEINDAYMIAKLIE